jgi:transcriptional regulator with XRE-family HTH domain
MTIGRSKKVKYGSNELERDYGQLSFGKLLQAHRISEEISQSEMARKLKISRQKLNDFERGRRFPSLRMTADVAKALGEHTPTWISVVLEEMLRQEDLDFKVTLAS